MCGGEYVFCTPGNNGASDFRYMISSKYTIVIPTTHMLTPMLLYALVTMWRARQIWYSVLSARSACSWLQPILCHALYACNCASMALKVLWKSFAICWPQEFLIWLVVIIHGLIALLQITTSRWILSVRSMAAPCVPLSQAPGRHCPVHKGLH